MTLDDLLTQILALLQHDWRVSYRALKRRFELEEDDLEDLKAEIIQAKKLAVDEDGAVLAARIDRLPAEEKRLLQTAAVIGTMDKNSRNVMTDEEHAELEKLVECGDRLMLQQAEATALLRKRGYTFT
jgi:hypothetical protein